MPLNRNYFIEIFKLLIYPLIACNAFSMCSDVLPSLAYFGISGGIVYILLAAVFLVWLLMYLSKSSIQSKLKIELEYYENKLMASYPAKQNINDDDLFYARYLVIFNEFRVKTYRYICKNRNFEKIDVDKILNKDSLKKKYLISHELSNKVHNMLGKFLTSFKDLIRGQEDRLKVCLDALLFKENNNNVKNIFGNYSLPDEEQNRIITALKKRDHYLIRYNVLLQIFLFLATTNIIVNALTMYGSASGVIRALATIFGSKVYLLNQSFLSVVFFLAGGCASLNLTYPMIQRFGVKLELVFQDFSYSIKNFSWYTVLAAIMAFFTAVGSSIFTLYNSPISAMMPPYFAGYAKLFTVVVAFFSVFSLYFVSVFSKFQEWFSSKNNYKVSISDIILASVLLFLSFLVDIAFIPLPYHGIIEVSSLLAINTKFWGKHGFLIGIALLAAFSFSVTSFHQFFILFNPDLTSKAFILFEVLFQFSTFTVTFYYGLNKFFSGDNASHNMKVLNEVPQCLKSSNIKMPSRELSFGSENSDSPNGVDQVVRYDKNYASECLVL